MGLLLLLANSSHKLELIIHYKNAALASDFFPIYKYTNYFLHTL